MEKPKRDDRGEVIRPAAWDVTKVESKGVVMQRAREYNEKNRIKKEVHFGSIKALCHIKNLERAQVEWQYKGRIVFRGDLVKDETGYKAVFTEQSTCASYMTGTKFLDIIARFPGCIGEDADATSAFTQITFDEAAEILGMAYVPETWISLPKDRWPQEWHDLVAKGELLDPVCPLVTNLYGHPIAGLLWDKCSQNRILQCGFEKVTGWESLYVHRKLQVFLGLYVDDFHMAGKEAGVRAAWDILKKTITLGDVTNFDGNTYLGCTQKSFDIPNEDVTYKSELFSKYIQENTNLTASDFVAKPIKLPPSLKQKRRAKKQNQNNLFRGRWTSLTKGLLKSSAKKSAIAEWNTNNNQKDMLMEAIQAPLPVQGWYYEMEEPRKLVLHAVVNWPILQNLN